MTSVCLVDGKNFVFRHHFTHRGLSSNGQPTSVLYGCPSGLLALAKMLPETPICFVWDGVGETWRHRLLSKGPAALVRTHRLSESETYAERLLQTGADYLAKGLGIKQEKFTSKSRPHGYKAHREGIHASDGYVAAEVQIPLLKKFFWRLGIRSFEVDGLEGDDLIGILTTYIVENKLFDKVVIHSTDRDFYQFIGPKVQVLRGRHKQSGKPIWAHKEDLREEFGIGVEDWRSLRALIGEKTDNIPHLFHGLGPKTAVKWLELGVDPTREKCPVILGLKLKGNPLDLGPYWEAIRLNYQLCTVVTRPEFEHLDKEVASDTNNLLGGLDDAECFCRDRERLTDETWDWMTKFFVKYELAEFMGRRKEFWELL